METTLKSSIHARNTLIEGTDFRDREAAALQDRALSAVSKIRTQHATMKAQLDEARDELARLQTATRQQRAKQREVNEVPVAALRRQVAYRLHPDRGGDAEIMTRLNALFDLIESVQAHPEMELAA